MSRGKGFLTYDDEMWVWDTEFPDYPDMFPVSPARPWAKQGACADMPHEKRVWFMPEEGLEGDPRAIAVCQHACPVRRECYFYGKRTKAEVGVWGGYDFGHAFAERDRRRKRKDPNCYCGRPQCTDKQARRKVFA